MESLFADTEESTEDISGEMVLNKSFYGEEKASLLLKRNINKVIVLSAY